jgi:ubiquinone/menaquinone biosynthesis C-methylase UbiE
MDDISVRNLAAFERRLTMRAYRNTATWQTPEAVILAGLKAEFAGTRILDIGVGGGRTTPHLLDISGDYIGIDYSPKMVAECRKRFPSVAFHVCDARDLSAFGDKSFGLVMFSFNGIDNMNHADRLQVFAEVRRVMADGGAFVFSSHNRTCSVKGPWSLSHLFRGINPFANPLHLVRRIITYPVGILNYYRNRRYEEQKEDYALVNDGAHEFGLIQYYISPDRQVRQLECAFFRKVRVVSLNGRWLEPSDYSTCREDAWLYYVCRR